MRWDCVINLDDPVDPAHWVPIGDLTQETIYTTIWENIGSNYEDNNEYGQGGNEYGGYNYGGYNYGGYNYYG